MSDDDKFKAVCKEVFGVDINLTLEEGAKIFSGGLKLPKPKKTLNGEIVYSTIDVPKFINVKDVEREIAQGTVMKPTAKIATLDDIKKLYHEVDTYLGSKSANTKNMEQSDNILGSMNVFMSEDILSSKFIGFSRSLTGCEYVYGSRQASDSSFCIRIQDSKLLSNCFETSWSAKCSNLMFSHNCFDVRDSMFCHHVSSKQYCIANRQYTKEEYEKIRKMVVEHLLKNNFRVDFFPQI